MFPGVECDIEDAMLQALKAKMLDILHLEVNRIGHYSAESVS